MFLDLSHLLNTRTCPKDLALDHWKTLRSGSGRSAGPLNHGETKPRRQIRHCHLLDLSLDHWKTGWSILLGSPNIWANPLRDPSEPSAKKNDSRAWEGLPGFATRGGVRGSGARGAFLPGGVCGVCGVGHSRGVRFGGLAGSPGSKKCQDAQCFQLPL